MLEKTSKDKMFYDIFVTSVLSKTKLDNFLPFFALLITAVINVTSSSIIAAVCGSNYIKFES
jgi:hypothetical protein